ncbi:MAG: hypothetical protein A3C55_05860 [Gammaproteobacteria bacterium RIFCSPHIGHO2_02_FULL_42_13]|nr:MAG: hypothetical protein A3C55_05860 [Gammaproteobacteria bacterium RIFCSPHIGHO2_02_FULL_42_13]
MKKLSVFELGIMTVAGVFMLNTLPLMAVYGFSSIFYYLFGAILYFIPLAFICAELSSGWAQTGGAYIWIREAFGSHIGFLGVWLEWSNTVISFPALLVFIGTTFIYAINPALANNKYIMLALLLTIFWGLTIINFLGFNISGRMSVIGFILGSLLPILLLIALSIVWLGLKHPSHIHVDWHLPTFNPKHSAFLVGLLLGYAGIQITAYHAQEIPNAQKNFPRAILIVVILMLFISIGGSLAIAIVVPSQQLNIISGVMQAIALFLAAFHLQAFIPYIAILIALGLLAMLNLWVIGPSKGLCISLNQPFTHLLVYQAIIITLLSVVYLWMPNIQSAYWMLIALTAILTLMMNILMFASLLRLRYTQPNRYRTYRIPGKNIGAWIVCITGMVVCFAAIILGFFPPIQLKTGHLFFYETFLMGGIILIVSVPLLFKISKS